MRRIVQRLGMALALAVTLLSGQQASAQAPSLLDKIIERGELRVGWAPYFPHLYMDPKTNEVSGISADILKLLAESLKVKLVMVEDNWSTLVAGLQAGKFDMTPPAFAINLPRAVAITYTNPVYQTPIGLMVRKEDASKWPDWQAVDKPGIRITTTLGSSTDQFLSNMIKEAEILRVRADPDSLTQLMTGRAEAWGSTIDSFEEVAQEHPELVPLENGIIGYNKSAIAVPRGEYHWRDYLNYFIAEIQDRGVLRNIFHEHGLSDDYLVQR